MELISVERRNALHTQARRFLKVELRDHYAVDDKTLTAWRAGGFEAIRASAEAYRDRTLARGLEEYRRIKVVSEPFRRSRPAGTSTPFPAEPRWTFTGLDVLERTTNAVGRDFPFPR
ncbi:DUF6879 family protein [Actinomadura sp. 6N118]|uniref:DUF6879 family protein n=1 Tax=Actinomadura sp. 6N118 TaxID=3375151 RepID=UPI0037BB9460